MLQAEVSFLCRRPDGDADCLELRAVEREEVLRERPDEQIHAVRTESVDWTKEATWQRKAKKEAAVKERSPALQSLFKKGENVIVRLPHVRKGIPPYSKPMTTRPTRSP